MTSPANQAGDFWDLRHPPHALAVADIHSGAQKTYGELRDDVERFMAIMPDHGGTPLCLLLAQNRYECIVAYLAALKRGVALILTDATVNRAFLNELVANYRPDFIFALATEVGIHGYRRVVHSAADLWHREAAEAPLNIHPSLALLLNTSGSTGSAKLVRLTMNNLRANAASIVDYLGITAAEKPISSLPMAYSYGLSVINSHLLAGATLVLTEHGVLRREFWDGVDRYACTSFAGVPHTYEMLLQTGLLRKRGATLRTLTQAGGRLSESHVRRMHELATERGFRFFVMYGQTEATARISYLPLAALHPKPASIGIPIPGGALRIDAGGELIYSGPNVMMGYATSRQDLEKGDELHGILNTGDLGRQDRDGYFYITGRSRRFLKLFGKRFNLDELEGILHRHFAAPVACFGEDDLLMVALEATCQDRGAVADMLRETFGLPAASIRVTTLPLLPRTLNGKIDYQALAEGNAGTIATANLVSP